MCYYRTSILGNGWNDNPKPVDIENAVNEIMENHSGTLNILFSAEDVLLVFEWDCLNLSIYNLSESMKEITEKIALSESFFVGKELIKLPFTKKIAKSVEPVKDKMNGAFHATPLASPPPPLLTGNQGGKALK